MARLSWTGAIARKTGNIHGISYISSIILRYLFDYRQSKPGNGCSSVRCNERNDLLVSVISQLALCKVDSMCDVLEDGDGKVGVCDAGEERAGGIYLSLAVSQGRDRAVSGT